MSGFVTAVCFSVVAYLALTVPRPSSATPSTGTQLALDFTRRAFHGLGESDGNITLVAGIYQDEFDALNAETNGTFAELLTGLIEMRIQDITKTLDHTLALQSLVHDLINPLARAGIKQNS